MTALMTREDTACPAAVEPLAPSSVWLATVPWMPPVEGAAVVAERLLLHVHFAVDWDGWVSDHVKSYWERILPERVVAAALRSRDLRSWWTLLVRDLGLSPRYPDRRREIDALLSSPSRPVLTVIREQSEALLLRTRLVADAVRETREPREVQR